MPASQSRAKSDGQSLRLSTMPQLPGWLAPLLNSGGGLKPLMQAIEELPSEDGPARFAIAALERFGVSFELSDQDLKNLPATGPVVIVANHPFGGIDGLIAIAALAARRPDLQVLAHGVLRHVPALADIVLPIDPFGGAVAARNNAPSVRRALRHLDSGGALLMFPAGEVSHFSPGRTSVSDPAWNPTAARIVQLSGAPVMPLFFQGRNSLLFQVGGMLHPRIRTLLLAREITNKSGQRIQVRAGKLLPAARLTALTDPNALIEHLRAATYLLDETAGASHPDAKEAEPLRPPVAEDLLAAEVAALPAESCLATCGTLSAYLARAQAIPHLLQEIGRRREESFRAVGEGTGRSYDIDLFDNYYEHLFVWDAAKGKVVGGYRIARIDVVRRQFGSRGLYLNTLFEFRTPFFRLLGPALELGRSFVSIEYQRSYAPLLLLWRGICAYVAKNPRYSRLLGPASLSNDYDRASRDLLVRGLRTHRRDRLLAPLVKARNPFLPQLSVGTLFGSTRRLPDLDRLDRLVTDRERDGKGLPVLLRHYLKLGARTLSFNVDASFGQSIDCLITLDLRQVPAELLKKYLSVEALEQCQQYWRASSMSRRRSQQS